MPKDLITQKLDELGELIRNSAECRRYHAANEELKKYPEKEKQVHAFRKRNYQLQNSKEHIDLFEEVDKLAKENEVLLSDPVVAEFLASEVAVCRLLQQINQKVIDSLEFEVFL